jgi:WS/DGAT/MGAT family acyltransferase
MSDDRLSGLDTSFLHLERDGAHMHVASTVIFEGPAPAYGEFVDQLASRLHLVPRFRQKLRFVPFDLGRPVWEDDPHLNLGYHVRHTALPPPGDDAQLRIFAARVFSQRLDRSKPLWELWLVDGLQGGRWAVVGKSHHALVDGVSGVDITTVLYDTEREPMTPPQPDDWLPGPARSDAQLIGETVAERVTQPREIVRTFRAALRGPRQLLGGAREALGAVGELGRAGMAAPASPFNVEIGPYRRFAWVRCDLDDFKLVKNGLGGTVNDVVLAAVSGALGRYLRAHGHSTQELELRAMVPISVRTTEEHGALGNRVTAMMAPLPLWCEDPASRLEHIRGRMGDLKDSRQAVGASLMTELSGFAPPTIAGQAARLQARQRFFNLVVTNIPGPQFPLYCLGREMECVIPMVPLAKNQAVCVAIMSYNGQINFGLTGDYDAMPDLDSLADDLRESIEELVTAAGGRPKRQRGRRRRARAKADV